MADSDPKRPVASEPQPETDLDSDKLNRWLTLGANLGVLIGIFLLIVELAQNREMIRAQTRNEISVQLVDLLSQVATNDELSRLLVRSGSGEPMSIEEASRFQARTLAMLRYFENVHYQYRQGMYDEHEFSAQREAWRRLANDAAFLSIWCSWRETFSPEFRKNLETILSTHTCS